VCVRVRACVRLYITCAARRERKQASYRCHEMDEGGCGYIWVGKEAGTKRAGRHGEKDRGGASEAYRRSEAEARDGDGGGRQTRNSSGGWRRMLLCCMASAELVPGKQSARGDSSAPKT
jgi:hypothetical protein